MNQVLRKGARKEEEPMMMKSEIHDTAAAVVETGASPTPQKAPAKEAGGRTKAAPKGAKAARPANSSKPAKPGKKAARKKAPPRGEQGRDDPGNDRTGEGSDSAGDHGCYRMAGAQCARIHLDGWQEAWRADRVFQE